MGSNGSNGFEGAAMTHRLNRLLLGLALLTAVPFWWLLVDNRLGDAAPYPVHIDQLRVLAAALSGPRPTAVEVETVASRLVPGSFISAGRSSFLPTGCRWRAEDRSSSTAA